MTEADDKVARMVAQMYREETLYESNPLDYQLHLAVCETMKAEHAEANDGAYGCDTGCEYYDLRATIKCDCPTIADEVWSYGSFGDTGWLLEKLIYMDEGKRDNLDHYQDFVFKEPAALELRRNLGRIEVLKANNWVS